MGTPQPTGCSATARVGGAATYRAKAVARLDETVYPAISGARCTRIRGDEPAGRDRACAIVEDHLLRDALRGSRAPLVRERTAP